MKRIGIYIDWLQTPEEVPQEIDEWIVCRSFDDFKNQISEIKKVPELLSLGFPLDEASMAWCLNPDNEGTRYPYEKGGETTMKCLVFLYQLCKKNSLIYKDITIHTEQQQAIHDLRTFIVGTSKELGIDPPLKVKQWEIKDDFQSGPNWKAFVKVSNPPLFNVPGQLLESGRIQSNYVCSKSGCYNGHTIATYREPTIFNTYSLGVKQINLCDYPHLIPHMLKPLRDNVLKCRKYIQTYWELLDNDISPKNALDAATEGDYTKAIEYLEKRGSKW